MDEEIRKYLKTDSGFNFAHFYDWISKKDYMETFVEVGDGLRVDIDLGFGVTLRGDSGRGVNIRLFGIDAPESRTRNKQEKAHGLLAKKFVQEHCQVGEAYILRTKEKGKFGRWLGEIKTGKGLITKLLIKNKLAVEYHGQNKKEIKAAHEANRQELIKMGLL